MSFLFIKFNIIRNTHGTKQMSGIKTFYFRGRKATPKKFTPHPGGVGKNSTIINRGSYLKF